MFLYGASGHAKVIIDILESNGIVVEALFDDDVSKTELLDYPVFHTEEIKGPLLISIGDNKTRKRIAQSLHLEYERAIHPTAIISKKSSIKEGSVVMQGCIIQSSSEIGKHCIVNTGASVGHDCIIDDYVHIAPRTTLCGNVRIGEGTWVGAGSIIIPGIKIGKWCIIGAGSVVTKDISDNVLAIGNPCKIKNIHING